MQYPDRVDHYRIDDSATDARMGRRQSRTLVATGVKCWVFDTSARRDLGMKYGLGREEAYHTHTINYAEDPRLTNEFVVEWTPDGETVPLVMTVVGQKIRPSPVMPFVVMVNRVDVAG